MIENGKISPLQFGVLVFMFALGSAAVLLPSIVTSIAKQDAWISLLLSVIADVPFIILWNRLSMKHLNESIVQYSERILGKFLGKLVGLMYISFFLYQSALVLRNIGGFITTNVLTQTPTVYIHIIFLFPVIYAVYLGLEVIARTSEVLLPWIVIFFLIATLLLLNNIDLSKLLPILSNGWQSPVKGLFPLLGFPISELVVFLMIYPFIDRSHKVKQHFILFLIAAGLLGTLLTIMAISVLGVEITARSIYAPFELAKEIKVGRFIERVEVLVGGIWITTIFVKLSFVFYAANLATAQLFNLKSYRSTILPYGLLILPLSLVVFRNPGEFDLFVKGAYPIYSLIHGLVIPAVLLLVSKIRKI